MLIKEGSHGHLFIVAYTPLGLVVNATIDSSYVSGLSLAHGLDRQRKHVWTLQVHLMKQLYIFKLLLLLY